MLLIQKTYCAQLQTSGASKAFFVDSGRSGGGNCHRKVYFRAHFASTSMGSVISMLTFEWHMCFAFPLHWKQMTHAYMCMFIIKASQALHDTPTLCLFPEFYFYCCACFRIKISMYRYLPDLIKAKRKAMIRNWYNQIPYPALKTKREITKYINWRQFTKGTRGKQNEQLFPKKVVIQLPKIYKICH